MDERELVRWLAERLNRRIPKHILDLLRSDGYLTLVHDDEREETLRRTRFLLQWNPTPQRARKEPNDKTLLLLAKGEELRRDAISEYWAKDASRQPEVRRFRLEVLGGRLLTRDEAEAFLRSPAAQMFSSSELASAGVDPARHSAEIAHEEAQFSGPYRADVRVENPSVELSFARTSTRSSSWAADRPLGDVACKVNIDGRKFDVRCWSNSTVDEWRRASITLEGSEYPWQDDDAGWFLLTGLSPRVLAVGYTVDWTLGSRGTRAVINLQVEPWISVERVADLYKRLQDDIIGGHNRPVSERRITLFRFVTGESDEDGGIPPWRVLMAQWNKRYPKWNYENVRNFSRDYWAGARTLVFPKYRPFWKGEKKHV